MNLPPEFAHADVPVLNRPFEILGHLPPTAIVQCNCDAKAVLVLTGAQTIGTCPGCQHRYAIMKDVRIEIGAMRPAIESAGIVQ